MGQEIERKFLVVGDFKKEAFKETRIIQGYLSSVPERTVRVRIKGEQGFITVKGIGNSTGVSRFEWEKEIPISEIESLLLICEPGIIDKTRYEVKISNHIFEVDEFHGENQGLVIAEVELKYENEFFAKPTWIGLEVTGNNKYYNNMLVKKPFLKW